ncbi:hypothetical protein J6590_001508 [Homalodisca vitripennis]|nr:hypothetical protein J6590_001508 [Homalodisca vitripennis]
MTTKLAYQLKRTRIARHSAARNDCACTVSTHAPSPPVEVTHVVRESGALSAPASQSTSC